MRVLLINVNCNSGSTGKITYDLYKELNSNGHVASICYGRGKKISEPNIVKTSTDLEMYAHAFLTRITGLTGYFSPFATRKLIKHIKEFKPDVVHIHEPKTYYLNIGTLVKYLKKNNIKTIWTLHSEFLYTGKCGYSYDCERWKNECGKCPKIKGYPKSIFFDFTRKMRNDKKKYFADFNNVTLVTPSKWLADRARQSYLKNKEVVVIHNGIDTNTFHPVETNDLRTKLAIGDKKVILAVAPDLMSSRKGGRWVLELAKRLKNEPIIFILIGVTDLNEVFEDNIIALQRTENQQDLAKFYSLADLFVICSQMENFPTTCIEALACGTPVIGFDVGGTKETAPEGYGLFVPYGDIDQMSQTVLSAIQDKTNLKSKYECAIFGKDRYEKKEMYEKYLNMYNSEINNKN